MRHAIELSIKNVESGGGPFAAVGIIDGKVLAEAVNTVINDKDPTAHAEIQALRAAAKTRGNYRLPGCVLAVTIEPCIMCMGAIIHARVARVVFGAPDPRWGAAGSLYDLTSDRRLNHHPQLEPGGAAVLQLDLEAEGHRVAEHHDARLAGGPGRERPGAPVGQGLPPLAGLLSRRLVARIAIRVELHGKLAVGAFQRLFIRLARDPERFVKIGLGHGLPLSPQRNVLPRRAREFERAWPRLRTERRPRRPGTGSWQGGLR